MELTLYGRDQTIAQCLVDNRKKAQRDDRSWHNTCVELHCLQDTDSSFWNHAPRSLQYRHKAASLHTPADDADYAHTAIRLIFTIRERLKTGAGKKMGQKTSSATFTRLQLLESLASIDEGKNHDAIGSKLFRFEALQDHPSMSLQIHKLQLLKDPQKKRFRCEKSRRKERSKQGSSQMMLWISSGILTTNNGSWITSRLLVTRQERLSQNNYYPNQIEGGRISQTIYCSIKTRHVDVVKEVLEGSCQ